jgi:hypothetical protein
LSAGILVTQEDMSGFDTSQPITDDAALEDIDDATKQKVAPERSAEPDELGDATPGPR